MQLKTIAVVGPGGSVGSLIIENLIQNGGFKITAIVRPSSKYASPTPSITVYHADFDDQTSLAHALQNQDALVCCVPSGATQLPAQKCLIDAAIDAGVKLFFASEYASNIMSPHYAIFPTEFAGEKVKVRQYLEEKAAAGQIAWTSLNGGPFFDMWLTKGVAGFNIPARRATIYGTGNNPACWTPLPVIASAAVRMLADPAPIRNRGILVSGVRNLTQNTILEALEAETGEKFEVEWVDVKKVRADALAALKEGNTRAAMMGLLINSNFNEEDSAANFWDLVENEVVGIEPVDVREAVREYLKTLNKA